MNKPVRAAILAFGLVNFSVDKFFRVSLTVEQRPAGSSRRRGRTE